MANKFEDMYGNPMDPILTATSASDGLMSKEDKVKLDTIISKLENIEKQQQEMLDKLKTAVFIKQ